LLAKERRSSLGVACKSAIQNNFDLGKDSPFRMHDGLVWELCAAGFRKEPTTDAGVTFLTSTLGHSNSALRIPQPRHSGRVQPPRYKVRGMGALTTFYGQARAMLMHQWSPCLPGDAGAPT
jgi:hypothetical protein